MKTRPKLEATHQNDVLVPRIMLSFLRIILNGDFFMYAIDPWIAFFF